MKVWQKNLILVIIAVVITVVPLIFVRSEFAGADGQAEEAITEIAPDYEPWVTPLAEAPGGETESLLFALQAAIGGIVIGFGFGRLSAGQNKKQAVNDN